jgi:peptidoglycan hydrolase CwlO-like protein
MFIQSFILCIIAIFVIFYKKNDNISFYKKINDSQKKVLLLSNIIIFRNSLLNYCDSEKLTDLINEIKNNDLLYYDQLFKIKKKIDIYYKLQLHPEYIYSDTDSDINSNSDSDSDINSDSYVNTEIKDINTEIKDINTEIKDINTEIKDINTEIKNINIIEI